MAPAPGDATPRTARLVRQCRTTLGLSRSELGRRAETAESTIAGIEHGAQAPSLAVCLRLARALNIPARDMIEARALDELQAEPRALRALESDLGSSAWREAARHRLRIVQGDVRLEVEKNGTLHIERAYRGCTTVRARREIVFRDRIVGEQPSAIDVQRTPIGYRLTSRTVGDWREHRIQFDEDWIKGSIDVTVRVTLPHAYVLGNLDEFNRRQKAAGLAQQPSARGVYQYYLLYAFENLALSMRFPKSYGVDWSRPMATADRAQIEDGDLLSLSEVSAESHWTAEDHGASLRLKRPLPSNSVVLMWNDRAQKGGARHN